MSSGPAAGAHPYGEQPVWFHVNETPVLGIMHSVPQPADVALLLVVGGPQYRVGSHRQFVLLARAVAAAGFPVLRFDYRGMGDSHGDMRDFTAVDDDINAAAAALRKHTGAARVVIWGLCDAASAALMSGGALPELAGLVLLNPWVHSERTEAQVRLRSYYWQRLMSRDLWRKILRFDFDLRGSLAGLLGYWREARAPSAETAEDGDFITRMRRGLEITTAPVYLILSGDDLTAGEFEQLRRDAADWRELLAKKCRGELRIEAANHTFARREWRDEVAQQTVAWLREIAAS